jgi:ParB family transcriptional regulator, chromosome partitioning protein
VAQGLSVRDTERLAQSSQGATARRRKSARGKAADGDVRRLENELADALGAKVRIESSRGGAGRIVIGYATLEQLDGLLAKLKR